MQVSPFLILDEEIDKSETPVLHFLGVVSNTKVGRTETCPLPCTLKRCYKNTTWN